MLGLVGACFHSGQKATLICRSAATAWCVTWSWSQSWEKPRQSQKMLPGARLPQPVSPLHPFLVARPGLARVAEAGTSTATAHGLVTAGAVSPPGPLHAGLPSPSPCPPLCTASFGGPGSSRRVALERRLRGPLLGLISPFSRKFLTWGSSAARRGYSQ